MENARKMCWINVLDFRSRKMLCHVHLTQVGVRSKLR